MSRPHSFILVMTLLLMGCAAMEIRVDAYTGHLTDAPDLQIDQAASIAMAAKPLLTQLLSEVNCVAYKSESKYSLENDAECITPKYLQANLDENEYKNWQAVHVKNLLTLYKNHDSNEYTELALSLIKDLKKLSGKLQEFKAKEKAFDVLTSFKSDIRNSAQKNNLESQLRDAEKPAKGYELNRFLNTDCSATEEPDEITSLLSKIWLKTTDLILLVNPSNENDIYKKDEFQKNVSELFNLLKAITKEEYVKKYIAEEKNSLAEIRTAAQALRDEKNNSQVNCNYRTGLNLTAYDLFIKSIKKDKFDYEKISKYIKPLDQMAEKNLIAFNAQTLIGGRMPEGLEYSIEKYLSASQKTEFSDKPSEELSRRRQTLVLQLTHFAEKLRVLGNTSKLMSTESHEKSTTKSKSYIPLLQTMGNGISTLIDDWVKFNNHKNQNENVATKTLLIARAQAQNISRKGSLIKFTNQITASIDDQSDEFTNFKTSLINGTETITNAEENLDVLIKSRLIKYQQAMAINFLKENLANETILEKIAVTKSTQKPLKTLQETLNSELQSYKHEDKSNLELGLKTQLSQLPNECKKTNPTRENWIECSNTLPKISTENIKQKLIEARNWKLQISKISEASGPIDIEISKNDIQSAKQAYDIVSATLESAHVNAVSIYGTSSEQAQRLKEAIAVNESYRKDYIHIRPAYSFLRNSAPATSLLATESATDTNLIFKSIFNTLRPTQSIDNKVREEIDNQSWQNVNNIKLSGTGKLLQILVKDDLGNWYVKGYSADRSMIFKSLLNAAKYHFSAQYGQNFNSKDFDKKLNVNETDTKTAIANTPTLNANNTILVRDHAKNRYLTSIKKLSMQINSEMAGNGESLGIIDQSKLSNCKLLSFDNYSDFSKDAKKVNSDLRPTIQDYQNDLECRLNAIPASPKKQALIDKQIANAKNYQRTLMDLSDLGGYPLDGILQD